MKKTLMWVFVVLAIFLVGKAVNEFKKYPTIGKDVPAMNTISVSGEGEVVSVPDIATFTLTVTEESLEVNFAQSNSANTINAVTEYLEKNGVNKKDIKTIGYNIYPRYEYTKDYTKPYPYPEKRNLVAYVVSQSLEVKVRKIADAGKMIGGLGEIGVTEISALNFGFDKDETLKAEARKKAITSAKEKARLIARDLGVSLGRLVNYSESGDYPVLYGRGVEAMSLSKDVSTPNITPGESKINSTVNLTYEIK
jgi:uncharacterized protein YggE